MTSRERVYTAMNRKEPDKVPICFGGTPRSGIEESPQTIVRQRIFLSPIIHRGRFDRP